RERAKLYEACVKVILQAQYVPDDPARQALVEWGGAWEDQRNWLATLALAMHEGGRAGAAIPEVRVREVLQRELAPTSVEQFLEAVRYRGGLLEERAELFQFVHLTFQEFLLLLSLGKQLEQRGMRVQKVLLRGPFSLPPRPFAHFSAPSRCSCGSHRSARLPLGSEIPPRSSVSVSPCGCLAPPGCCQRARSHRT